MAANSEKAGLDSFRLFPSSDEKKNQLGLGFLDYFQETPLPPPPPCTEILPSEVSSSVEFTVDPVNLEGISLLKENVKVEFVVLVGGVTHPEFVLAATCPKDACQGRVSTHEVFALSNLDLVPGKYEGGLKLWEGSLDLIKALLSEVQNGKLTFKGKRVLELGCGHGLPGIFASLQGSAVIHFQDFNAEVLRCLTIPNVNANLMERSPDVIQNNSCSEIRYFAGDWSEVHDLLSLQVDHSRDVSCDLGQVPTAGYDIILMAETVYSISALQNLYELIKKCINRPYGVIYMAAKKHYFGVGGGTRRFLSVVEKDGTLAANLVAEVADGSSNVREVWKLSLK